jgi:hypothetical protein
MLAVQGRKKGVLRAVYCLPVAVVPCNTEGKAVGMRAEDC